MNDAETAGHYRAERDFMDLTPKPRCETLEAVRMVPNSRWVRVARRTELSPKCQCPRVSSPSDQQKSEAQMRACAHRALLGPSGHPVLEGLVGPWARTVDPYNQDRVESSASSKWIE